MYRVGLGFVGIFPVARKQKIASWLMKYLRFFFFVFLSSEIFPHRRLDKLTSEGSGEVTLQSVACSAPPRLFEYYMFSLIAAPSTSGERFDVLVQRTQRPGSLPYITSISLHISYPARIYSKNKERENSEGRRRRCSYVAMLPSRGQGEQLQ